MKTIDRERTFIIQTRTRIKSVFRQAQARWKDEARALTASINKASGAMIPLPKNQFGLTAAETDEFVKALQDMAKDGAYEALASLASVGVGVDFDDVDDAVNAFAETWARNYGGAMISNITDTTRSEVADLIGDAVEEGWSNDKLADMLETDYTFDEDRAEMIARTETAYADVAGNVASYEEAGVEKKRWLLGPNSCSYCEQNADDGDIDFNDTFTTGDFAPPAHPNCTCDIMPVLD